MSTFDWSNPTVVKVCTRYAELNRRATPQDCSVKAVYETALYYARNYDGDFSFMCDMRNRCDLFNTLSAKQAAGVINCLMVAWKQHNNVGKAQLATLPDLPKEIATNRTIRELTITATCAYCGTQQQCLTTEALDFVCADREACHERQRDAAAWAEDERLFLVAPTLTNVPTQEMHEHTAATVDARNPELLPPPVETTTVTPVCKNGTYTVVLNETGDYRTLRLIDIHESMRKPVGTQIAAFLCGSDNESDYKAFAFVTGDKIGIWKAFKTDSKLANALRILLNADRNGQITMGESYAIESGRCFACGKKLTVPVSVARGLGPICAEKY